MTVRTTVCETARLRLRHFELDDAEFLHAQLNEAAWLRHIGDRGVRTVADARRYLETTTFVQYRTLGYGMNLVELKSDATPLGVCGLVRRDWLPHPDLGFALLERHWGRGYAREAADAVIRHARQTLGLPRLNAITTPDNGRSAALLRKLGFRLEEAARSNPLGATLALYAI